MLPWIFIHGYILLSVLNRKTNSRFNVAMDFHPWIQGYTLQGTGHHWGFNVAMDFHPWILGIGSLAMSHWGGFNVAMDFHPWIQLKGWLTYVQDPPLQCCHGFSSMDTESDPHSYFFIHLLQCCHGFSSMDTAAGSEDMERGGLSFNVAMDFHPWIRHNPQRLYNSMLSFNVAMDFHPWILKNSKQQTTTNFCFNVAMDFHPWILNIRS